MQRLLPFAFAELFSRENVHVHEAIAAIAAFFRDLCSRSLTESGLRTLEQNIPIIICNLEKVFPPSFFDVMEHLPIHLPREAALGGPVQYRWMYPFERYMFHLKKKVKNLSKVEGSIVAQSLNEETTNFSSYYFAPKVQTKARKPSRYDDGGERPVYHSYVPSIFQEIGRLSGKRKGVWLTDQEVNHIHTYILRNCNDVLPYESKFADQARESQPSLSDEQLEEMKQLLFANWLKYYVNTGVTRGQRFPTWFEELVGGPLLQAVSSPMYCTRGYVFRRKATRMARKTVNSGVVVKTPQVDYYGEINDILEVEYPGLVNLKCILFKCEWYDPTYGQGFKVTKFGVTQINSSRRLGKYDPFILASQADQVCYLPFPRTVRVNDPWITVTQINLRSRVEGSIYDEVLQQPTASRPSQSQASSAQVPLVNVDDLHVEELPIEADEECSDEFAESSDEIIRRRIFRLFIKF